MNTILHVLSYPVQPCRNARGSSAVGVGITLLPFLLAFFGVIEFGMYYFHQHTLQAATHEGIRVGLLGTRLLDAQGKQLNRADSIVKAITDKAENFLTLTRQDIKIHPVDAKAGVTANAGKPGELMKVQVDYTHQFFSPLIEQSFGKDKKIVIHAEGTYRNEDFL